MKVNLTRIARNNLGLIFSLVFIVILYFFSHNQKSDLNKYGQCTIGTVDHLGGTYIGYEVFYNFQVNEKWYEGSSFVSTKQKQLIVPNKKFVVKYDEKNPTNSEMLLGAPISESMNIGSSEISKDCCEKLTKVLQKK